MLRPPCHRFAPALIALAPIVLLAVLPVVLLAGCSSAPTHFYTLLPAAQPQAAAVAPAPFAIEVAPVGVPAEVDQAAWLVRTGPGQVALLDSEQWAAPLADELRAALADELTRQLGARQAEGGAGHPSMPVYRIQLDVRRFDSTPGQYALIEADWNVARRDGSRHLSCSSRVSQAVEPGYAALALGHQRAVAMIADAMASAVRSLEAGTPACPAG
jgi:uncharacterized protein